MKKTSNLSLLSTSVVVILICLNKPVLCGQLNFNEHFIPAPQPKQSQEYRQLLEEYRRQNTIPEQLRYSSESISTGKYFTFGVCMIFDRRIYDPDRNIYTLESFIKQGEELYGGYDIVLAWHGYPRLGVDERNQFDFWSDLPGGLEKLSELVTCCHAHRIRVILPYNPWDTGTRVEPGGSIKTLVQLVRQTGADGVFLDTLSASSPELRKMLDSVRPGLLIVTEGIPPLEQAGWVAHSWGQWLDMPAEPGLLKLKWIYPRHQQYFIRRWDRDRSEEIAAAFFNGSGIVIWDNIFGTANPWSPFDRLLWKKASLILHHFSELLENGQWTPFRDTPSPGLYANQWQDENRKLYIFVYKGQPSESLPLISVRDQNEYEYLDLWHGGKPLLIKQNILYGPIHQIGCIAAVKKASKTAEFIKWIDSLKEKIPVHADDNPSVPLIPFYAETIVRTKPALENQPPEGMVFVPAAAFNMRIRHPRRECGCYLDKPSESMKDFGYGLPFGAVYPDIIHKEIEHQIGPVQIEAFFIDRMEVSNLQFKIFLEATNYRPEHPENFLKHWPGGRMPDELANHPVVYVDIDDAKAYAKWAGKRLATEAQWQLAAQGTDGREWPWGNTFQPNRCTTGQSVSVPVDSYSEGQSPYGCYHMSGNVWEWTDAVYDDGYTRFTMIRGGSFYQAQGSVWYIQGGPKPCGHHVKFILTWPGLDRCSTIGFRCVKDIQ